MDWRKWNSRPNIPGRVDLFGSGFLLAYVSDVPLAYTSAHWPEIAGKSPDAPLARTTANISWKVSPLSLFVLCSKKLLVNLGTQLCRQSDMVSEFLRPEPNPTRGCNARVPFPMTKYIWIPVECFFVQLVARKWVAYSRLQVGRKTFQRDIRNTGRHIESNVSVTTRKQLGG
jgi:hypothetical protein